MKVKAFYPGSKKTIRLQMTVNEVELLIEALQSRAARHESMAIYRPSRRRSHDVAAAAMRVLAMRVLSEMTQ